MWEIPTLAMNIEIFHIAAVCCSYVGTSKYGIFVCLSTSTLYAKSSMYVRNKGHREPEINFQLSKLWFKAVTI